MDYSLPIGLNKGAPSLGNGVVLGVATAFPETRFTQAQIKEMFGLKNKIVNKLMDSGHIKTRHLYLPNVDERTGELKDETPAELNKKFLGGVEDIGVKAALKALTASNTAASEVDQLIAVTSTGFAVPGVSSIISRAIGCKDSLHRLDVVGMGCNAGMSALYSAAQGIKANPDLTTLMVCVEISSASYVKDETIRTGIVNSLFGDGAAAIVLKGREAFNSHSFPMQGGQPQFTIVDFETYTIAEQWDAMRFDYNADQNKWSFFLSKDIPFVIGENMKIPVQRLLERNLKTKMHIDHWVMHTGGGAVIDGAMKSVGLSERDVRHTRSVLRDYGNLSSGSFLVSLERLYSERRVQSGDFGVLIAMGPGSTIEAALVQFL